MRQLCFQEKSIVGTENTFITAALSSSKERLKAQPAVVPLVSIQSKQNDAFLTSRLQIGPVGLGLLGRADQMLLGGGRRPLVPVRVELHARVASQQMQQFGAEARARKDERQKVGSVMKVQQNVREDMDHVVEVVQLAREQNVDRVYRRGRRGEDEANRRSDEHGGQLPLFTRQVEFAAVNERTVEHRRVSALQRAFQS